MQGRGPSLARDGLVLYIRRFELITSFIYLYNEHFELIACYNFSLRVRECVRSANPDLALNIGEVLTMLNTAMMIQRLHMIISIWFKTLQQY